MRDSDTERTPSHAQTTRGASAKANNAHVIDVDNNPKTVSMKLRSRKNKKNNADKLAIALTAVSELEDRYNDLEQMFKATSEELLLLKQAMESKCQQSQVNALSEKSSTHQNSAMDIENTWTLFSEPNYPPQCSFTPYVHLV